MNPDIQDRTDLLSLIESFYEKLLKDPDMAPIFLEVAKIDVDEHFPILVDFWESVLFHTAIYKGNAMTPHLQLHDKFPLKKIHFKKWLAFFNLSVDELFSGEKAELIKERAKSIALLMEVKVNNMGLTQ